MDLRVLCFIFASILCEVLANNKRAKFRAYEEHIRRVENYQKETCCGEPKETLVHVSEIDFEREIHTNEAISPFATVLHRCDTKAGCGMNPGKICTSVQSEIINLTFLSTMSNSKHVNFLMGFAQNHTRCECQNIKSSLPK